MRARVRLTTDAGGTRGILVRHLLRRSARHRSPLWRRPWGDLPAMQVAGDGRASHSVLATGALLDDIRDRSPIIQEGSDNYADDPQADGGGGTGIAV